MNKYRFYLLRMCNASWPELLYRIREKYVIWRLRGRFRSRKKNILKIPRVNYISLQSLNLPEITYDVGENTLLRLSEGDIFTIHCDREVLSEFEKRHRKTFFADIPLSEDDTDIRMIWEPARLQHIMIMLLACRKNEEGEIGKKCCDKARETLFAWLTENPFLAGPHYLSAMECGLRIPVFFCNQSLGRFEPKRERENSPSHL